MRRSRGTHLALSLLSLLWAIVWVASPAHAQVDEDPAATIRLVSQTAWTTPERPLVRITVRISNVGDQTIPDAVVGWRLGPKVLSRVQYETALAEGPAFAAAADTVFRAGDLAPGASMDVPIKINTSETGGDRGRLGRVSAAARAAERRSADGVDDHRGDPHLPAAPQAGPVLVVDRDRDADRVRARRQADRCRVRGHAGIRRRDRRAGRGAPGPAPGCAVGNRARPRHLPDRARPARTSGGRLRAERRDGGRERRARAARRAGDAGAHPGDRGVTAGPTPRDAVRRAAASRTADLGPRVASRGPVATGRRDLRTDRG